MPVLQPTNSGYTFATSGRLIIKRAMRLIGALDPDEECTAGETSTCLEALNKMLDSWNAEGLMLYGLQMYSVSTSVRTVTLGPGGILDMPRPSDLSEGQVFLKDGIANYRIKEMTQADWARVEADTISLTLPGRFYYDKAFPAGNLNFDVTPDRAYTLEVYAPTLLQQIAKAEAAFTLPPSYADALDYNLAARIAPEFGQPVPDIVTHYAVSSKAKIQRKNMRINPVRPDAGRDTGRYDINSDSLR